MQKTHLQRMWQHFSLPTPQTPLPLPQHLSPPPSTFSSPLTPHCDGPWPVSDHREPVRILVVGTAHGIDTIVHTLYAKGFAHISEWSRLMPHSPGKLMRILTRYVRLD
ncbi:peptide ABC transporter substrate-binding protein [Pseudanabaena sp. FACHB-2040]|uniref:peptide ABC transporter substrate-binding protein n=1 Tax=Pseudanabaena sp. FACHB-2040 TaxID=2692859 RepID=UPI0016835D8D|nr:peptide ABC transporter substrate-binding protein [Pseudanabaena sp. FACHB-2040]MBD2258497.1 peptide ABC transporter substrate-binding protein [Pseudanabaena sp. FACHB-2040]